MRQDLLLFVGARARTTRVDTWTTTTLPERGTLLFNETIWIKILDS